MKNTNYILFIFLLFFSNTCVSQDKNYSSGEQTNIQLFNNFKNYLVTALNKNEDIEDISHLKYILSHFVFVNKKPGSLNSATTIENNLSISQEDNLKKEVITFYNYLREHQEEKLADNITLTPIRISYDTLVYNRFTRFQKGNTYIFFDKRFPRKTLGYVLFMPVVKDISTNSRIWSWTLLFKFGKYMFRSVTGEEGYEYMFDPGNYKNRPLSNPSF